MKYELTTNTGEHNSGQRNLYTVVSRYYDVW